MIAKRTIFKKMGSLIYYQFRNQRITIITNWWVFVGVFQLNIGCFEIQITKFIIQAD
jgi:hypothetical protein